MLPKAGASALLVFRLTGVAACGSLEKNFTASSRQSNVKPRTTQNQQAWLVS
jgi:hypothetical protein